MPELPEVETVARELGESLPGRTITGVTVRWPRTVACPPPDQFREAIAGRRVTSVGRRGKYVVLGLDRGFLLIHLKMSGRLYVVPAGQSPDRHEHTVFDLDDGQQLRFRDVRKFGRVYLVDDVEQVTGDLGPEPLADDFTLARFRRLLERRSGRLKSLLLNQSFVAGLGNIYADETLFRAGLHPLRRAGSLSPSEQERLYNAIRSVLRQAVANRGTTLSDGGYVDARGEAGQHQEQIMVYGRGGEPCLHCGTSIERLVIGGRSSHFCPCCQKDGTAAGA
ncbi:MAG: bifunctional DNA-formamidopyrimidine glycosylase/DNA-(apurinic or apyrimidinic site) lyase [Anaerolineae bacterium]